MSKPALKRSKQQYAVPLFDRLQLDAPYLLDEQGVKDSVAREVAHLLNTRFVWHEEALEGEDHKGKYPLLHGFQDLASALSDNRAQLAARLQDLVLRHEPRLADLKVESLSYGQNRTSLHVVFSGTLLLGERRVAITFPIGITPS